MAPKKALFRPGPTSDILISWEGVVVTIKKGSIVDEQVDVIINSVRTDLVLDCWSISKTILQAAGQGIQDECNQKAPNGIQCGDFVETSGGQMQVKSIYHGAVAQWDIGSREQSLKTLLDKVLLSAHNAQNTSLALPALGTGNVLKFPPGSSAEIILDCISTFSARSAATSLKNIRIVLHPESEDTIRAFEKHSKRITECASQPLYLHCHGSIPTCLSTPNGITVTVKKNDITQESVDVIVNSTKSDLDLNTGHLSKALLNVAGNEIQDECLNIAPDGIGADGNKIAITSSGKLICKAIYHGCISQWESGRGEKTVRNLIKVCLDQASKNKMTSIAFPPIGTGILKFPTRTVMKIFLEEIYDFSTNNALSTIKDVRIVLHGKFSDTLRAFGAEIDSMINVDLQSQSVTSLKYERSGISIQTKDGLVVLLRKGSITDEQVDCIVNTIPSDLNLSGGSAICKAVLNAAGDDIKSEIYQKAPDGLKCAEIITTSAGNMKCNTIYHGWTSVWNNGIGEQDFCTFIRNILMQAHQKNRKSLSLPAIGTGNLGVPPAKSAQLILQEITNLSDTYPQSTLKEIHIVLFPTDLKAIQGYSEYIREATSDPLATALSTKVKVTGITAEPVMNFRKQTIDLPLYWDRMMTVEKHKLVELAQSSLEYKTIAHEFVDTGGPNNIIKIQRNQCLYLYEQYALKKRQMEERITAKGLALEKTLYHGTRKEALDPINMYGFNRSYCGVNGTVYGKGVYFAKDASYSSDVKYSAPDSDGLRYIYRCRVLCGEYTKGERDYRVAPPKSDQTPHDLFDSVVNDENDPGIYVVFYDAQAYPEYIITFKT